MAQSSSEADGVVKLGLFVPKPSSVADHLRCGMPDLGMTVYRRPLASTAGDGDSYSLGYSAARAPGQASPGFRPARFSKKSAEAGWSGGQDSSPSGGEQPE
jgi:hypothetical protein